jgi:hypothetical protein
MAATVDRDAVLSTISLSTMDEGDIEYLVSLGIFDFLCCLKIEDLLFLKRVVSQINPETLDLLHAEACACGPCGPGNGSPTDPNQVQTNQLTDCQKEAIAWICGDAVQTVVSALIILVKGQETKDYDPTTLQALKYFRMFLTALQLVCVSPERAGALMVGICWVYLYWRSHEGTGRSVLWQWLTVLFPIISTLMNLLGEKIENCCRETAINQATLPDWAIELTKESNT